jgi:hypothetical protein
MTSSQEIDETGGPLAFSTHPTWIGRVLRGTLPVTVEPLAVYYSWEFDTRTIPTLLVLPSALVGVQIDFVGHSQVLSVTRSAISLDDVVRVTTTMRSALVGSDGDPASTETQSVEIELRRELPPFDSVIKLPLSRNDYRGNWDEWRNAARSVADALLSLGRQPGPSI